MKDEGFRVGIRIAPLIPGITELEIIDEFIEADFFSIDCIKLVPQNDEAKKYMFKTCNLNRRMFEQKGLLKLKQHIRKTEYEKFKQRLEDYGLNFGIADAEFHHWGNTKCCCGENLVTKSTDFNTRAMLHKNIDYNLDDVLDACGKYNNCIANHLFSSDRVENCKTVSDFFKKRFRRKNSPFSKKFLYQFKDNKQKTLYECI